MNGARFTDYRRIAYTMGLTFMVVGWAYFFPLIMTLLERDTPLQSFLIPFVLTQSVGLLLYRLNSDKSALQLNRIDSAVSVVFAWALTMAISTIPFLILTELTFLQALFESVSGWTTTGLSMLDVSQYPNSLLLFRSLMQFLGGFGLIAIMMLSVIGVGTYSGLYQVEGHDAVLPSVKKTSRMLFSFYLGFTVVGIVAYVIVGMPLFDAINHTMSAISTGGFSVQNDSIGHYQSLGIEIVTIVLMLLGGTNFALYILVLNGKFKAILKLNDARFFVVLLIVFIPFMMMLMLTFSYAHLNDPIRVAIFEVVSALSTTGYSISDYSFYAAPIIVLFIVIMLIGGQSGSTSGGIKMTRISLMLRNFWFSVRRVFDSERRVTDHVVYVPTGSKRIHKEDMINVYNFAFIYMLVLFFGTLILTLEGFTLQQSLFEFASTIGTVGLSVGLLSSELSALSYVTMIFGMFLGRLEFMIVFIVIFKIIKDAIQGIKGTVQARK